MVTDYYFASWFMSDEQSASDFDTVPIFNDILHSEKRKNLPIDLKTTTRTSGINLAKLHNNM